jgi:transglutaminase-like putative cysteine protease
MLGSRVGTSTVSQAPTTHEGKEALRVDSKTEMKIVALATIEQNIQTRQVLDPKGHPLALTMTMESGGRTTRVDARFGPRQVECTVESGGTKTPRTVEIPEGVTLVADPEQFGAKSLKSNLKPGTKLRLHMFEPMTLQIMPLDIEVVGAEKLTLGGKSYETTVINTTTPLTGGAKSWIDDTGELLQLESALGMKMVRESVETPAPAVTKYVPPSDFAVATSIRTKTQIKDARSVAFLRLRVEGVPEERLILTDARQSADVQRDGGTLVVTYAMRAHQAENGGNEALPGEEKPVGSPERLNARTPEHLSAAPYLEVDDPRIRKQAQAIIGDATDPLEKARKIRAWVFKRMTPKGDIGVIRSATDVLQHPAGVCRDYAILTTALARAAGVPARVVGGIVYCKDGFFYHAWTEVQPSPGSADWVPFDSTLPTDFVDATHIKFAQGDATAMFGAIRVVGQLKAEVLEYR